MNLLDTILGNSFIVAYAIALIISLIRYTKYFETPLQYFPILILYTLLNEILGLLIVRYEYFDLSFETTYRNFNIVIYAIYNIFFFLYFYYLYWNYTKTKKHKEIIIIIGFVFCLVAIINMFLHDITTVAQIFTYFTGAITLIYCALYYLKKLPKSKREKNLLFWISIGLVIFFIGYLPIKLIHQFEIEDLNYTIIWRIHMLLILAMYICFIIGFIKMKPMKHVQEEN